MTGHQPINDAHFHVGQFRTLYVSPKRILQFMDEIGIERIAVSSTSICGFRYRQGLREIKWLIRNAPDRIVPVLRVTPDMLQSGWIDRYIYSGIKWGCVKIHRLLGWSDDFLNEVIPFIELAVKLNIPVLFHTGGGSGEADAGVFEPLVKSYPECPMILAHARPVEQTLDIMRRYDNAWCDTAFQTAENVVSLVREGLSDRILWGTDYPIPRYFYPHDDMTAYYHKELSLLSGIIPEDDFNKIAGDNFNKIFRR